MRSSTPPVTTDSMEWRKLPVPLSELCLSSVLRCGQSFRWKSSGHDEWSCALGGRILSLRQDPTHLYYRAIFPQSLAKKENSALENTVDLIQDYFNLSINLTELYEKWSSRDPHFKRKAPSFTGIRMLRQDPWENLISFICSSNNNISRIGQMVENLCINFGTKLGELGETSYYDFPIPSTLTLPGIEEKLRAMGFGYRAKYIHQTALMVVNARPVGWLDGLRKVPYKDAHEALLELQGVGPKVADCVCLMSLDKTESVPVDTHVWQIAMRDYKFGKGKHKSLTKATYIAIGDHFRELWGNEAGWAHSVLFAADLKAFSDKEANVEKSATKTTTIIVKKKAKVEANNKSEDEIEVKAGTDTKATAAMKKESGIVKIEANQDESTMSQSIDTTIPNTAKKRGRKAKAEIEEESLKVNAKLGGGKKVIVKEERGLKRILKIKEGLNSKLEDSSLTMADRIKRRKRR